MDDLISIIIPIFNLQPYLENCLESIISQTYQKLEIILINDASTDGSLPICRSYEKRDSRITIIDKKKNEGAGMTRNAGIDIAHGKYIMFVDGDDFIAADCVEELYSVLRKGKGDIAVCRGKPVYNLKRIDSIENKRLTEYECMTSEQALENICYQRKIMPGPWGKLFRTDLFDHLRFPDTGYEDLAIIYHLMHKADVIIFSPVEKYYYLQRRDNTTLGKFNKKKLDRVLVAQQMMQFIEEHYEALCTPAKVRFFIANIQTLNVLPFALLTSKYGRTISQNMKAYRRIVLSDKKAKISTRCMAAMSWSGVFCMKLLGTVYNFVRGNYKARLK